MNNRNYNVLFHLHTVSGIVISVLLYVIFFAGSFSFFRDDIVNWERGEAAYTGDGIRLDFDKTLHFLDSAYTLQGRNLSIAKHYAEENVSISLEATQDSSAAKKARKGAFFYLNSKTGKTQTYEASYSLGEFLYRLHFFAQIPKPAGHYLSGFTALFFLFALVTGILVHWKKIIPNFYVFRPKEKLKTLWTDAHTALGLIGMPFYFVYAVTGAFFMLSSLIVAPSLMALYGGDKSKMFRELGYSENQTLYLHKALTTVPSWNNLAEKTAAKWKNFEIAEVKVQHFGDESMRVIFSGWLPRSDKFTAHGKVVFNARGKEIFLQNPTEPSTYVEGVKNVLYRLHYADYGGYGLRIVSFLMGLLGCFVILSGVMIWLTARDKKNLPEKKRRFNHIVVRIYLAVCLSMYPVTALSFLAVKCGASGKMFLYTFYFLSWLVFSIGLSLLKNPIFTLRFCLISGSLIGFCIPVANGLMSGNWFWQSLFADRFQLFFVDFSWIVLASVALYAGLKIKQKGTQGSILKQKKRPNTERSL